MKQIPMILLLFLMTIGIEACRSRKKTVIPDSAGDGSGFYPSCYPIASMAAPSCKLEISDGNNTFTLSGSIYIRPDSICYFRGSRFGIEAVRGIIYRDSFVVINYVERICYRGKNEYLQRIAGYPINPESLTIIFTADRCEDTYRNKLNFTVASAGNEKIVMQGKNQSRLEINISHSRQTVENITLYNNREHRERFSVAYGGYQQAPQFSAPTLFDVAANDGKKTVRIKADFRQILFDQPQQAHIRVPSNYRTVLLQ